MIIGVVAGSVFANMTYQANYYFLADLNMDVSSIKQMDDASMVNYTMYILGKRIFQILLLSFFTRLFVMEALIVAAGFTGSFVFSVFITYQLLQTGISGVGTVLLAMCPQWIFYGAAICWWVKKEKVRDSKELFRFYLVFAGLAIAGMISEILINPRLLLL